MSKLKRKLIIYVAWFKELFRFCPATKRRIDRNTLFLNIGHRGSPVNEPENTIPSFKRALREGANALEADICVTKDKEVILWHDWNPDELVALIREQGLEPEVSYKPDFPAPFSGLRNKTSELNLDQIREHFNYIKKSNSHKADSHIPTLREFLEWTLNKEKLKYVFLDIKIPTDEKKLIFVILDQLNSFIESNSPKCKFIIESFSTEVIETAKSKYPDFNYCLDVELPPGIIFLPRIYSSIKLAFQNKNKIALVLRPRQITIANWMTYRRIIGYDVRKRNRINKKQNHKIDFLIGCTINKKKEMECLIKSGINGLQTDYPRRLTNIVKKYELNREINSD